MTEQDPYVEKVIEENEERAKEHKHDGESKLEREVESFFEPVIDVIERVDGQTAEERQLEDIENDREQRPD
jgi:hypothetical protein